MMNWGSGDDDDIGSENQISSDWRKHSHGLLLLPFVVVLCVWSEFCGVVVGVLSSLAILLRRACCIT